jgi:hypothetical protein
MVGGVTMKIEVLREGRNFLAKERLEVLKKLEYYDKEIKKITEQIQLLELERKIKWPSRHGKHVTF